MTKDHIFVGLSLLILGAWLFVPPVFMFLDGDWLIAILWPVFWVGGAKLAVWQRRREDKELHDAGWRRCKTCNGRGMVKDGEH